jgi:TonB family protein
MTSDNELNWPPSDAQAKLLEVYELRDDGGFVRVETNRTSVDGPALRERAPVARAAAVGLQAWRGARLRAQGGLALAALAMLALTVDYGPDSDAPRRVGADILLSFEAPSAAVTGTAGAAPVEAAPVEDEVAVPRRLGRAPSVARAAARAPAPAELAPAQPPETGAARANLTPLPAITTGPRPIVEVLPTRFPRPFPSPGARARVILSIDAGGRVQSARVVGATVGYLEAPLLQAARKWRYEPARRDGISVISRRVVDFVLP